MNSVFRIALFALSAGLVLVMAVMPASAHDGEDVTISLQYDSLHHTVISYTVNDFAQRTVHINGKDYLAISVSHAGYAMMNRVGHPQVPALCNSLMIPDNARMETHVLHSEYYDIQGVNLVPYKGPIPRSVDPATVPYTFGEVYGQDAWFPKDMASLRDPYILHDARGVVVEVFPFQYNPVKRILRVYNTLEVEVVSTGTGEVNVIDRSIYHHRPDRSFEAIYRNQFLNYSGNRPDRNSEDGDILVISHGPFMSAVQPYVDWKKSIGFTTTLVDVGTIGNTPTSIKNHIDQVYKTSNLAYVLLVGDYNEVESPMFGFFVSDPKYSTLTEDWYPDVFVGRFSAQNVDQLNTQVSRTITYEQEGHNVSMGGWNAMGMGIASDEGAGWGHYGESDKQHEDLIRNELMAYGFTKVDQIYDPGASKSQVTNGLNEGRRVLNYTGHGITTGWVTTGFSNYDVDKLSNVGMLPFIHSVACLGGDFKDTTCFGEAWLRATHNGEPTGAIASYNSSRPQYWAEPMYAQGNHCIGNKLGGIDRFWTETNWSVCGCWFGGCCIMMDICGTNGRQLFMTWHCFGDPALRLTGVPADQTLLADGWALPLDNQVTINFTVTPGDTYAGYNYFLLSCISGTMPGTQLPGGVVVPLNFDPFTFAAIANANGSVFQNFYNVLDAMGEATATLSTFGLKPLNPYFLGTKLSFAAVIWPAGGPYELATNVKTLTIVK